MLKARVITALLLLVALLSALFWLPATAWTAIAVLLAALAAWEWAGLLGRQRAQRAGYALAVTALTATIVVADAVAATSIGLTLIATAVFFWCFVVPVWLLRKWKLAAPGGYLVGFLVIVPTVLALIIVRRISPGYLLASMAIVWIADIAAFFVGRAFGKHKLAPQISPGKSWEGAFGGAAGVLVYGGVLILLDGRDMATVASGPLLAVLLWLTALSILGDLFESLAKRQAGVKDSGNLLPGHGGLLDRIDSLTATLPAIALMSVLPLSRAKLGL